MMPRPKRMSAMRCLVVHNFYQQRGGEDVVFEAETAMLRRNGHAVDCFTLSNDAIDEKSKLATLALTLWNDQAYRAFQARIAEFQPQIIHFHNLFPLMSPSVLFAARDSGAGLVMTLHNYRFICPSANLYRNDAICSDCAPRAIKWPAILHKCYRGSRAASAAVCGLSALLRLTGALNEVNRFIALSQSAKEQFIAAGFPSERLTVKPHFVPPPPLAPIPRPREAFALFVGRMVPEKGVKTLLEAWRRPDGPQVPLMLVGEGPLAPVRDLADGRIIWLGRRDTAEVHALMRRASLLVFPSEWYEPFGLTIIEAFASGLPVLAARIGAAAELVEPGVTGSFFEPGSASDLARVAARLLSAPETTAAMGWQALAKYRTEFTPERNLEMLEEIYQAAIFDALARGRAPLTPVSVQRDREAG
jgi:glycosyltransferase involved in cell wall biosynthesis